MNQSFALRQVPLLSLLIFFQLTANQCALASSNSDTQGLTPLNRDAIIRREMDCVDRSYLPKEKLDWTDVCAMNDAPPNENQRDKMINATIDEMSQPAPKGGKEETPTHQFQIGSENFYSLYQRKSGKIALQGMMHGFTGRYTYHPSANVLRLEGLYAQGKVDYSSGSAGSDYNVKDIFYETRGLIGRDWAISQKMTITPLIGFGYRHLVDDSSDRATTDGFYGWRRDIHYYYIPIGFEITSSLNSAWNLTAHVEYDYFLRGLVKNRFSDLDPYSVPSDDVNNTQKKGMGWRGSLQLLRRTQHVNFFIEPFIRFFSVRDSEAVDATVEGFYDSIVEKKNKTTEVGVKLGIQF